MRCFHVLPLLVVFCGCNIHQADKTIMTDSELNGKEAVLSFNVNEIVLGDVDKSSHILKLSFDFVNRGRAPLIIDRTDVSCGCVKVTYPKEPVFSGKHGVVQADLNISMLKGTFTKKILVFSNSENGYEELLIRGNVKN